MATTTNYAWETPDDTDLVKDGAAAIRTLGSSIDTTTKALNPSTTLGDIEYRSSTANTNTRLGIGTTGQVLTVAGGVPSWATPSSAVTFSGCGLSQSGAQSISNTTQTDLTFDTEAFDTDAYHSTSTNTARITIPSGKGGYFLVTARVSYASNGTGTRGLWLRKNGSEVATSFTQPVSTGDITTVQINQIMALAVGDYITMNAYQASGGSLNTATDQGKTYFAVQYLGA